MQIVIDVPEKLTCEGFERPFTEEEKNILIKAIGNGTPLPKGHGRLIDADELKKTIQENDVLNMTGFNVRLCDINSTPTIIEADKAESEDKE